MKKNLTKMVEAMIADDTKTATKEFHSYLNEAMSRVIESDEMKLDIEVEPEEDLDDESEPECDCDCDCDKCSDDEESDDIQPEDDLEIDIEPEDGE